MRAFNVDFYLWYDPAESWLLIPPHPSALNWTLRLSQHELLLCEAGLTFRVDDVLWLGNERDLFSLEMVFFELENTLNNSFMDGDVVARLPVSEFLAVEARYDVAGYMLLNRYSTRERTDYFEEVAHFAGTYYQNFVIEERLWREAVDKSLDGLAVVFGISEQSTIPVEYQALAQRLLERYHKLRR